MKLFLGVDGGQSSTVALIGDETGRVLGAGLGGPCNHVAAAEGRAKFARALEECIGGASAQAGIDARSVSFAAACLGFSGGVADKEGYSREFVRSRAFKVTTDADIALTGATGGQPGIIVIAGTGSIALGKNAAGKMVRAGGWGYILGDEGGAFDIVRQALRAALAMEEGWGELTSLRDILLAAAEMGSANALMHAWYNSFDRAKIARLAPMVDGAALGGDKLARRTLEQAGQQLAGLVEHVHRGLFKRGETVAVSFVGGVFESGLLKTAFTEAVREKSGCDVSPPLFPPAAGALLEALRMDGRQVGLSEIPAVKS